MPTVQDMNANPSTHPYAEIAEQIAAEFGDGARAHVGRNSNGFYILFGGPTPDPKDWHLDNPGFYIQGTGEKWRVSCLWPHATDTSGHRNHATERPHEDAKDSIGIGKGKSVAQVVKDIKRRLDWTRYLELHTEQYQHCQRVTEGFSKQKTTLLELAEMLGTSTTERDTDRVWVNRQGVYELEVSHGGDRATLQLCSLPLDTVKAVIELLKASDLGDD